MGIQDTLAHHRARSRAEAASGRAGTSRSGSIRPSGPRRGGPEARPVKALKAYLGYLHYEPYSPGYRRYFKLAAKYKIPVIFHSGDTYSRAAKVKFAHPLQIDEVAVDFPETKFVLAHFGNPWLMDAAQVVYKNKNVWADLSAILIGDAEAFAAMEKDGVLDRAVKRIKEGIEYAEAPERFLFGSDWPLSPIAVYRDFVRQLFRKISIRPCFMIMPSGSTAYRNRVVSEQGELHVEAPRDFCRVRRCGSLALLHFWKRATDAAWAIRAEIATSEMGFQGHVAMRNP